ncbi:MAG: hypothetical protein NC390_01935 [Fusobacterium sp.]|nr:hypothetical protein [Fusobacterium sp.]
MSTIAVSRFTKLKNAFTTAGRTQNRLMKEKRTWVETCDLFGNQGKIRKPATKFYSRKLPDGSTMLQGYRGNSLTSDATYIVGRDGAYMNIKRAALDPEKKAGSLISGQSRAIEHYNRQGLFQGVDIKSRSKVAGLPAQDINYSMRQGTGNNPGVSINLKTDDVWASGGIANNGNLEYKAEIAGQHYGGQFNLFEKLGKMIGLG